MTISKTFSALSEPSRQKILNLLRKEEMTGKDMAEKLNLTPPTLSHHLDILGRADLVSKRRNGQQVFYSLNLSVIEEVANQISKFLKFKT